MRTITLTLRHSLTFTAAFLIGLYGTTVRAAEDHDMHHHDMSEPMPTETKTEHGHDTHADMNHEAMSADMPEENEAGHAHDSHAGMNHESMSAPADAGSLRDPHAYAGEYEFGKNIDRPAMAHDFTTGALFINRLEQRFYRGDVSTEYDVYGWYGKDYQRLVLKAEGEVNDSRLEEARTELLWSSALSSFWDAQIGVRQDSGDGPNRTWLAASLQGLAPYWFEVDASAYLSHSGRAAIRLEVDYELLLTQKWILQPRVEANYFTKDDPERGIGDNFSSLKAGLRLRYEFVPEFAPYIGVEWQNLYGETKSLAREERAEIPIAHFVAGLKFWF